MMLATHREDQYDVTDSSWIWIRTHDSSVRASETVHALHCAATVIGCNILHREIVLVIRICPMRSENISCVLNAILYMTQSLRIINVI
jgi:hypothetical protein